MSRKTNYKCRPKTKIQLKLGKNGVVALKTVKYSLKTFKHKNCAFNEYNDIAPLNSDTR